MKHVVHAYLYFWFALASYAAVSPPTVYAAEPPKMPPKVVITIPAEVRAAKGEAAIVPAMCDGKVRFQVFPTLTEGKHYWIDRAEKKLLIWKPGIYTVTAWTAVDGEPIPSEPCKVWIQDGGPDPPIPPDPDPVPPIPAKKLGVLITYESEKSLTPAQHSIIYGKRVRDYLESHCDPDPDVPSWKLYRIWDNQTHVVNAAKFWQDINAKASSKPQPYIVITNGKETHEGLLPATVDETLKLLKKYGGE